MHHENILFKIPYWLVGDAGLKKGRSWHKKKKQTVRNLKVLGKKKLTV